MVTSAGFIFKSPTLDPVDRLTASCEQNMVLNSQMPFWKIDNIQPDEVRELECVDPSKCGEIPSIKNLINDFDGESNSAGDTFAFSCNTGRKGLLYIFRSFTHLL